MSGDWRTVCLGEVARFDSGHRNSQDAVESGQYPFFTCSQAVLRHSEYDFDTEAVIMAGNNAEARFHLQYFNGKFAARQRTYVISPSTQDLSCRFLYYALHGLQPLFAAQAQGTTTKFVTIGILQNAPLGLPPIAEQRAIAHILGTLDDKIDLNRRMNETLEAMARAHFKSWFVDFDPVRAKATGRNPGLPKPLANLFPDSFEDSEVGEIPTGWETRPLRDLLSLDKGLSYKGQFLTEVGVSMVNLGCFLGRGRFAESAIRKYSGEYKPRHVVCPRDLVLANTDITQQREVLGSPAIVPPQGDFNELIFSHHIFAARFHADAEFWKMFVYFLLLQDDFRARAAGFATGTTVLALPRDAVLELLVPGAPRALVSAFAEMAMPILEREWKSADESRTLAALRDTLRPKLISGELRVEYAEKYIERNSA
jgi:type I restriction enzyme S subunit